MVFLAHLGGGFGTHREWFWRIYGVVLAHLRVGFGHLGGGFSTFRGWFFGFKPTRNESVPDMKT